MRHARGIATKRRASAFLAVLLSACGGGSGAEKAFEDWKKAWSSKDWNKVYEMIPPSLRRRREADWERTKAALAGGVETPQTRLVLAETQATAEELVTMDDKAVFLRKMQEIEKRADAGAFEKMATIQLIGATEQDDRCTLRVSQQGHESQMLAVKEDGAWYIESQFER